MSLVERQCENMTGIQWGMTRGAHRHHEEQAVAVTATHQLSTRRMTLFEKGTISASPTPGVNVTT